MGSRNTNALSESLDEPGHTMIERDSEMDRIREALKGARSGSGSVVVVEGPAGIGKSSLLGATRTIAAADGFEVLTARGRESEQQFTSGGVLQLFEAWLATAHESTRARLLSGPAKVAAPLFGTGPSQGLPDGDAFSLVHGLYWLCVNAGEAKPLALCLDDAHWLDAESLRLLLYLAERVEGMPLVICVARPAPYVGADEMLTAFAAHRAGHVLTLGPLSPSAVERSLRDRLPSAPDRRFTHACFLASGGNPSLLGHVADEVRSAGVVPSAENAQAVAAMAPAALQDRMILRLRRLGDAASPLAVALAVLGDGADIRQLAGLVGLERREAAPAADALVAEGILATNGKLSFVHPVERQSVYAAQPRASLEQLHLEAARLLDAEGQSADRVGAHLLRADRVGDPWAVRVLTNAGASGAARRDPKIAVAYLQRALDEPPPAADRAKVLLALGRAQARLSEAPAVETLAEAADLPADPEVRSLASLELGRALLAGGALVDASRCLNTAIGRSGDEVPAPLTAELRLAQTAASVLGRHGPRLTGNDRREEPAEGASESPARAAELAFSSALGLTPARAVVGLAERALDNGSLLAQQGPEGLAYSASVIALVLAEELEAADLELAAGLEDARSRGSRPGIATAHTLLAWTALRRGRLDAAAAHADSALSSSGSDDHLALPGIRSLQAAVAVERGELDAATAAVDGRVDASAPTDSLMGLLPRFASTHLALLQGDPAKALEETLLVGESLEARGITNPACVPWQLRAAVCHHQLGQLDAARRLVEVHLERARLVGTSGPVGRGLQVLGTIEPGVRGLELLGDAAELLSRSPCALDGARALIDYGAALRRAGRRQKAREPLLEGSAIAEGCGAISLAARARKEIAAAGGRPRRTALSGPESLTPRERQVADLALEGLSNKEIASSLFVTVKTVEWHLGHSYRKLEVSSRGELAEIMSEHAGSPEPTTSH